MPRGKTLASLLSAYLLSLTAEERDTYALQEGRGVTSLAALEDRVNDVSTGLSGAFLCWDRDLRGGPVDPPRHLSDQMPHRRASASAVPPSADADRQGCVTNTFAC
jgi:hypothetical protein